jgi:hypothetical protein
VLAVEDFGEAFDGVADLDVFAFGAGEDFGHVEGLAEEALELAGAGDGELVVFLSSSTPRMAMMSWRSL